MPPKRILIVDDQPNIRKLFHYVLSKHYECREADTGAGAIAAIQQEAPDVVILDVMMPGDMDGLSVLQWIRNQPGLHNVRVIMATARGSSEDVAMGKSMGADAYLIKPFSSTRLIRMIEEEI